MPGHRAGGVVVVTTYDLARRRSAHRLRRGRSRVVLIRAVDARRRRRDRDGSSAPSRSHDRARRRDRSRRRCVATVRRRHALPRSSRTPTTDGWALMRAGRTVDHHAARTSTEIKQTSSPIFRLDRRHDARRGGTTTNGGPPVVPAAAPAVHDDARRDPVGRRQPRVVTATDPASRRRRPRRSSSRSPLSGRHRRDRSCRTTAPLVGLGRLGASRNAADCARPSAATTGASEPDRHRRS